MWSQKLNCRQRMACDKHTKYVIPERVCAIRRRMPQRGESVAEKNNQEK